MLFDRINRIDRIKIYFQFPDEIENVSIRFAEQYHLVPYAADTQITSTRSNYGVETPCRRHRCVLAVIRTAKTGLPNPVDPVNPVKNAFKVLAL